MKSKKGNMVAITMLVVLILAGGVIVASVKFQDNRKADRTNVQEHELELQEMVRSGYDDGNFDMNGVYYNHPTDVDGETCLWYRNRPTPPNTDQFLAQLEEQVKDRVLNNFVEYSNNLPVEISVGNIEIVYDAGYELPEDFLDLELYDLIINSDEEVYPVFKEDESGTYTIETRVGNIYNAVIAWLKTDAGDIMPKIQEKLAVAQCFYHACPCEHSSEAGLKQEVLEFQEGEHAAMLANIKEAINEATAEMTMDGYTCKAESIVGITDTIRTHFAYGVCPEKTPAQLEKIETGYQLTAVSYEMLEPGCETPLDVMSAVVTDGSVREKQIPATASVPTGDISDDPPQGFRTIYYDFGVDPRIHIDWKITCSNDVEGTYVVVPIQIELQALCEMPGVPPSGVEICGHDGAASGACILPDKICGLTDTCKPKYCDENLDCVEEDAFRDPSDWDTMTDEDKICRKDGITQNECGQFMCDWPTRPDDLPECLTWDPLPNDVKCLEKAISYECHKGECLANPDGDGEVCVIDPDPDGTCRTRNDCACTCDDGDPTYAEGTVCEVRTECYDMVQGTCTSSGSCNVPSGELNYDHCCNGRLCKSFKGGDQYERCMPDNGKCCQGVPSAENGVCPSGTTT